MKTVSSQDGEPDASDLAATMPRHPHFPITLHLFCKVVDNFGDIGICWRLARQLWHEHGVSVTLWVDDLHSFHRICPGIAAGCEVQRQEGVTVCHWTDGETMFGTDDVADIVIEFFGCDIPENYIAAMARRSPRPVWFNLEGLSAEAWVEGCHGLTSPHPRLPLTKYFFFPGFTDRTGGLLRETSLCYRRMAFQSDPAAAALFLARFGVPATEMASLKVSLFCYPHAPVEALLKQWSEGAAPVTCLVPEGVAVAAVEQFLGEKAIPGATAKRRGLTVRILPFVSQDDYDLLLWSCDLNFVRGEDSFVRAQWANRPFVWHIYPQEKNLHHVKLQAFLLRYAPDETASDTVSLRNMFLWWNDAGCQQEERSDVLRYWPAFADALTSMRCRPAAWEDLMQDNGDLAGNLLAFARGVGPDAGWNKV